jgi:hypothetical protein
MIQVPLYGRSGIVAHALIDDEDEELVMRYRWNRAIRSHTSYATTTIVHPGGGRYPSTLRRPWGQLIQTQLRMHRLVMGLESGDPRQPDHRDHDGLNNQRYNLRISTVGTNNQNKSSAKGSSTPYRGVYFNRAREKYYAEAWLNYQKHYLGIYDTPEEANEVASAWRREHMPFSIQ